jgi:hypothetical protein
LSSIKSLLLFFGPIFLPKAIGYYRSQRAASNIPGVSVRPVPTNVSRALLILFVTASVFLIRTLPPFSPENIFNLTSSRLQIPVDVLFTRLNTLRPQGLTPSDNILRTKIISLESRLLFFQYGPDVLTDCPFCSAEDPKSYLYYFLPALLAPHILNLLIIGGVTSGLAIGKEGAVWRRTGTLAAGMAMGLDLWVTATYNHQDNARVTRLEEIDTFFWKMRVYRYLALAIIDGLLGWMMYLSSTNRAFITAPTAAERIAFSTRVLDNVRTKVSAVGIIRNTVSRDEPLREKTRQYWIQEGQLMGAMMEEREVLDSVSSALENRINIGNIERDAEMYASNVLGPIHNGS